MKILFCSYLFEPSVGGIETVSRILAAEFIAAGHEVRLVTQSSGAENVHPFQVIRRPGNAQLFKLVRWADVVFHNNISLRFAWPLLLARRPWVIAHHSWIAQPDGSVGWAESVKERLLKHASNIAISPAIAESLAVRSRVIPDPYDAQVFHIDRRIERNRELIFVGRLVSDKGVDLLLRAMHLLWADRMTPTLSIVGDGPERPSLERLIAELGLTAQVTFHGLQGPSAVARLLNEHRIMVIPSRWNEPFGVVALEAIACGCAVVATRGGGLPNAVGPCGLLVPNGDIKELALALKSLLGDPDAVEGFRRKAEAHLKLHHPASVAEKYLAVFGETLQEQRR